MRRNLPQLLVVSDLKVLEHTARLSGQLHDVADLCTTVHFILRLAGRRNPGNEQRPTLLKQSRELATAARRNDVYAGIDVFARDRPRLSYDAGPGCVKALEEVAACGLSAALFAPGWTLENASGGSASPELLEAQFWEALQSSVTSVKDSKT